MIKWEYSRGSFLYESELNDMGDRGWELVTMEFDKNNPAYMKCLFKREIE